MIFIVLFHLHLHRNHRKDITYTKNTIYDIQHINTINTFLCNEFQCYYIFPFEGKLHIVITTKPHFHSFKDESLFHINQYYIKLLNIPKKVEEWGRQKYINNIKIST